MKERKKIDLGRRQRLVVGSAESMPELKRERIDVAVTSPPYNVGKNYASPGHGRYDDRLTQGEYLALMGRVFHQVFRVLKEDGLFFLNLGESVRTPGLVEKVVVAAEGEGFLRVQTLAWVKSIFGKGHYTPSGRERRLNNLWEYIFILAKGRGYRFDPLAIGVPYTDKSNVGRYAERDLRDPGNVWFIPYRETTGHTIKKGHDAVFPVELPWRCIKLVPEAKYVLDPFAGTCTTLAAAAHLGLRGIGYEPHPPMKVIERRLAAPFEPAAPIVLPWLERGAEDLFHLLAALQGRGLQEEVGAALAHLPRRRRERLLDLAAEHGFDFEAGRRG